MFRQDRMKGTSAFEKVRTYLWNHTISYTAELLPFLLMTLQFPAQSDSRANRCHGQSKAENTALHFQIPAGGKCGLCVECWG